MANQWALLIGINQYKALQPLMYAQSDAVGLRNFFVDELGVPVDHCTLLTDVSNTIEPHAYMPLKQEIEHQLQTLCRDRVQPGDLLWVFFSGCGLAEAGQDYWMTLDSDPTSLSETAIAVSSIFDILKTAKTDQIILAMDMNRSQGAVGLRDIGTQTLTLAKDYNLTTLLSCQPDQFSHETMYVRHGLFTKALLEGMRYHGCVTASQLATYLSDLVPELCEHHCRPLQQPVAVVPPSHKFMMVVLAESLANLSPTETAMADNAALMTGDNSTTPLTAQPITPLPPPPSFEIEGKPSTTGSPPTLPVNPPPPEPTPPPKDGAIVHQPAAVDEDDDDLGLSNVWKWGALAAAIAFLAGVFFRFQPALFRSGELADNPDDPPSDVVTDPDQGVAPAEGTDPAGEPGAAPTEETPPADANVPPPEVDPIEQGQTALQRAEAAIAEQRYGEARAWLSQVPPELQNNTYQSLLQEANSEVAEAAIRNQSILDSARQIIQPTSASVFNDAIEQARQVPPEDPYYEQAQEDIRRWGRVILDLAEGRAASGDIGGAIAAARLVPEDQPELVTLAQQRIQSWEQRQTNQELIRQAQNTVQPGQASSYNDAARLLEQIQPGQPGYEDARRRTEQWGEDILAIARARAAQGDLAGAVAAARLVPERTPAYAAAQEEIQRWQAQ